MIYGELADVNPICRAVTSNFIYLPYRKIRSEAWTFGSVKCVKESNSVGCGIECHREKSAISSIIVTTVFVERACRAILGIIYLFHFLLGQYDSFQSFASNLPIADARSVSQIASAFVLILSIRETKSRLFLSMYIASSAQ